MKIKLIFLLLVNLVFSQSSIGDLRRLANQDLDQIRQELQAQAKGSIIETADTIQDAPTSVSVSSTALAVASGDFFGYNYLRKDISFFDNIPTPPNYKLGPGDELIISIWGETNVRESKIINKDGMIYFDDIGFINLSNYSIVEAQDILSIELSKIYSTLSNKDNASKLMLSLGQLKSINIYFTGHVENPGINLVHPFSDIYSAIVQAGGINKNGSLRQIELIRDGKIISTVDFYSFFINGDNNFSDIKLVDGDVIHVPNVKKRISISGAVVRPSTYEILENENAKNLIEYASGLTSLASTNLFINNIIPIEERSSRDNARTTSFYKIKDISEIKLNNGDSVIVQSITPVNSQVQVFGRVKSPGFYPANNASLKTVLDLAGGFNDPIYRKSILDDEIVILRQDKSNFYSNEFKSSYELSSTVELLPGDKIFVYTDINFINNFTFTVEGEVMKPGTYPILKNELSLNEALDMAGGITELGSINSIIVTKPSSFVDMDGSENKTNSPIRNLDMNYPISENVVIKVLPKEKVIRVIGNVYNPGLIYSNKQLPLSSLIKLSGGYKPKSSKNDIYISRANGKTVKANIFKSTKVYPGDTVVIPEKDRDSTFNVTAFIADLTSVLANIVAILLVIDNASN